MEWRESTWSPVTAEGTEEHKNDADHSKEQVICATACREFSVNIPTCAPCDSVVVQQLSANRLNHDGVHLAGLQGSKHHLVLVFEDISDTQLSALSVQKHRESVHIACTGSPAHLQTAAVSTIADVDVLHFTGN